VDEHLGELLAQLCGDLVRTAELRRDLDRRVGRVVDDDVDHVGHTALPEQRAQHVGDRLLLVVRRHDAPDGRAVHAGVLEHRREIVELGDREIRGVEGLLRHGNPYGCAGGAGGAPKGAARNCGSAACRPVSKGVLTVYLVSVWTTAY
jgi:hypothetical protein